MSAGQAKSVAEAMSALWQGELPATLRVLSAVSDANRDYRPHDRSRSAWELTTHLATADIWFIDSISQGQFVFDAEKTKEIESSFSTVAEVVSWYQAAVTTKLDALTSNADEFLAEHVDFFGMMKMSRAQWIGFANNHSVHHRGQLSAYLRSMGCKVPSIYGPSADSGDKDF
jgi:uncharacterized damage-inducible protein DinB